MKAYTYQIGAAGSDTVEPSYSQALFADSLGEAIDKAKAITKRRPAHPNETTVRIVEKGADEYPMWVSSAADVRDA